MSLLKSCLSDVPPVLVPYLIAFVGTIGNIASDTANIIVPPIAALLYIGAGKHPIVGMICGYAGANAGFTANLMVAGTDSPASGSYKRCDQRLFTGHNLPGRCYL